MRNMHLQNHENLPPNKERSTDPSMLLQVQSRAQACVSPNLKQRRISQRAGGEEGRRQRDGWHEKASRLQCSIALTSATMLKMSCLSLARSASGDDANELEGFLKSLGRALVGIGGGASSDSSPGSIGCSSVDSDSADLADISSRDGGGVGLCLGAML